MKISLAFVIDSLGPALLVADFFIFKMADVSMKKVKDLIAKKDAIEKEIKEFQDVLDSVRTLDFDWM